MKYILIAAIAMTAMSCTYHEDILVLKEKRTTCGELTKALKELGPTKEYTKLIDDEISVCKKHGYWDEVK